MGLLREVRQDSLHAGGTHEFEGDVVGAEVADLVGQDHLMSAE